MNRRMDSHMDSHVRFKCLGPATARPPRSVQWLASLAATAGLLALVLALWAMGAQMDHHDEALQHAHLVDTAAFEQGRQAALQDMAARVASAYAAGLREGVASLDGTPQGLQLAQACLAWDSAVDQPQARLAAQGGR